jgi:hypothetical protein
LRLPLDVRRNRCHLVVRPAKRMMVRILCRNSRVQCLCLYVRNQLNPKCSRSPCSPGWWCAVQSVFFFFWAGSAVSWCSSIHVIRLPGRLTWGMYVYL